MEYKKLSSHELEQLHEELQQFVVKRHNVFFDVDTETVDQGAWLQSRGALTKDTCVVMSGYEPAMRNNKGQVTNHTRYDPLIYDQCENEWEQWLEWRGRIEYAQRKETEAHDEIAKATASVAQSYGTGQGGSYPYADD